MTLTTCPGASIPSSDAEDILDEALFYFRANVLFRNFEVRRLRWDLRSLTRRRMWSHTFSCRTPCLLHGIDSGEGRCGSDADPPHPLHPTGTAHMIRSFMCPIKLLILTELLSSICAVSEGGREV